MSIAKAKLYRTARIAESAPANLPAPLRPGMIVSVDYLWSGSAADIKFIVNGKIVLPAHDLEGFVL